MHKVYFVENKRYKSLNFLSLGMEDCAPSHKFGYAHTNFYLVHYVVSGKGVFVKKNKTMKVYPNQIFIIKPGDVYTYIADEKEPWTYIWFSFDGELASVFEKLDDVFSYDGEIINEMLEAEKIKNTRTEFLTGKLYEFMSSVFEGETRKKDYVKAASDFIKNNREKRISVSSIAAELNLSSRYLSRLFKEQKGLTIQEYIVSVKMKRASVLLSKGFNVSETAYALNYESAFSFSKVFKKYTGKSPSDFQKEKRALNV